LKGKSGKPQGAPICVQAFIVQHTLFIGVVVSSLLKSSYEYEDDYEDVHDYEDGYEETKLGTVPRLGRFWDPERLGPNQA
jgi:hypothetical protein